MEHIGLVGNLWLQVRTWKQYCRKCIIINSYNTFTATVFDFNQLYCQRSRSVMMIHLLILRLRFENYII